MGPGPAPRPARRPPCRPPPSLPHLAAPLGRRHGWIAPILCAIPPTSPLAARRTVGSLKRAPSSGPACRLDDKAAPSSRRATVIVVSAEPVLPLGPFRLR